jgi:hypothetical protein
MGVKLGLSPYGKNMYFECLRTGCWGLIFGFKRVEAAGGWMKLHKEEPHNLYA